MKTNTAAFKAATSASAEALAKDLMEVYRRHKKAFPGVWTCNAAKDIPTAVLSLREWADVGCDAHLIVMWQPSLWDDPQGVQEAARAVKKAGTRRGRKKMTPKDVTQTQGELLAQQDIEMLGECIVCGKEHWLNAFGRCGECEAAWHS